MNTIPNPYVGPRTFQEAERDLFYGREREASELLARVLSEQELVFYAQSGAGKSSLVNTSLIPDLKKKNFEVLLGRVGGHAHAGRDVNNLFVFNLLRSLSTGEVDEITLAHWSLSDFLVPEGPSAKRRALIIDQFEELFSTHHEAWEQRETFFEQLAQALEADPRLRVILVMREDYIAALDPYTHILPGQFRMRYYMQRLEHAAALKAVQQPVMRKEFSRPYESGAAEKLVDDLRSIKVIGPEGTPVTGTGQFVEPLYLQVICYELWNNLPAGGTTITMQNVQDVGDVSTSLGNYYARRVAAVAEAENVSEAKIRNWFTGELISPTGVRNMVLEEPGETSASLENRVIRALSDLIRAEQRGGAVFYELTHDRLVEPILTSNKKWFEEHLSPLQKHAALWHAQGRTDSWLLTDQALLEVEQWGRSHPDELTANETEFLDACQKLQRQVAAERLANERIRKALRTSTIIAGIASLLLVLAIALGIQSYQNQRTTQMQALIGASSEALAKKDTMLATLLAYQALITYGDHGEAEEALGYIVEPITKEDPPVTVPFIEGDFRNDVKAVAVSQDGKTLASVDPDGAITLWDIQRSTMVGELTTYGTETVAFSPDGRTLASAGGDASILLWDISIPAHSLKIARLDGHAGDIYTIAFSPDGKILASASYDTTVILWDVTDLSQPSQLAALHAHNAEVWGVAFSPDGKTLASGSWDDTVILWDVSEPAKPSMIATLKGHSADVESVAFGPDGKTLASVSDDQTVILWDVATHQPIGIPLTGHENYVRYVAFSPDGRLLASQDDDDLILLWDVGDPARPHLLVRLYGDGNVVFTPDGRELVSGSSEGVRLWDMSNPAEPTPLVGLTKYGEGTRVISMSLISGGKTLAALGTNNRPFLFDVESGQITRLPLNWNSVDGDTIATVIFSPDGKYYAAREQNYRYLRVWEAATGIELIQITEFGFGLVAAFSPDGKYLVSGDYYGLATVREIASGNEIARVKEGASPITAVAFSPNGKYVASAANDRSILIWDAHTGKRITSILHKGEVRFLAFSPDESRLALALADDKRTVEVWDLETREKILVIANGELRTLNYSVPGTITLRNEDKSKEENQPVGPSSIVSLSYTQEGLYILYQNGSIDHWNLWPSRSELKQHAKSVCGTCELTYAQRREYELYTWPMRVRDYAAYPIVLLNLVGYAFCVRRINRSVFARPASQRPVRQRSWKSFLFAVVQGVLLILFSLLSWGFIGFFEQIYYFNESPRDPGETILYLGLLVLPFGLWPGGSYAHLTRLESGKWSRTKRTLVGLLAGCFAGGLAGYLGFVTLGYGVTRDPDVIRDVYTIQEVLIYGSVVGGLLSLAGALIYIFGLSPWSGGKMIRPKTIRDWPYVWWVRGIAVSVIGAVLGFVVIDLEQHYMDLGSTIAIILVSLVLGMFGFMFYPHKISYILTAVLGSICTFIWLSNFDTVPISIWFGLGSGFIFSALISRILHAMHKI